MSPNHGRIPTPPPRSPSARTSTTSVFDIVAHYNDILRRDHDINQPIAAVESLIALLSASPPSTVSETLTLIESSTTALKSSSPNSLSLTAGTDLFQRYILSALQAGSTSDFEAIRAHLLANSKVFVERAKQARGSIARIAKQLVRDESIVLTYGHSRVVKAVLNAAVDDGTNFSLICAQDSGSTLREAHSDTLEQLRRKEVPVAIIPFSALATATSKATLVMVGAESLMESGGVVSSMGTRQIGILARDSKKPLYVVAESHKLVKVYPLSPQDLGLEEDVFAFKTRASQDNSNSKQYPSKPDIGYAHLDYSPPSLITAIVTESGVHKPNAISEDLMKIWS